MKMRTQVTTLHMAEMLAAQSMDIAALTPKHFAEWLVKTIS